MVGGAIASTFVEAKPSRQGPVQDVSLGTVVLAVGQTSDRVGIARRFDGPARYPMLPGQRMPALSLHGPRLSGCARQGSAVIDWHCRGGLHGIGCRTPAPHRESGLRSVRYRGHGHPGGAGSGETQSRRHAVSKVCLVQAPAMRARISGSLRRTHPLSTTWRDSRLALRPPWDPAGRHGVPWTCRPLPNVPCKRDATERSSDVTPTRRALCRLWQPGSLRSTSEGRAGEVGWGSGRKIMPSHPFDVDRR